MYSHHFLVLEILTSPPVGTIKQIIPGQNQSLSQWTRVHPKSYANIDTKNDRVQCFHCIGAEANYLPLGEYLCNYRHTVHGWTKMDTRYIYKHSYWTTTLLSA